MNIKQLAEEISLKILDKYIQEGKVSESNAVDRYLTIYNQILEDLQNQDNDFSSDTL